MGHYFCQALAELKSSLLEHQTGRVEEREEEEEEKDRQEKQWEKEGDEEEEYEEKSSCSERFVAHV